MSQCYWHNSLCGAATFAQVIQDHTEEFLKEMIAKEIAPKLKEYKLIPESVEFDILQSKTKELANICLLRHLKENADEEAATKVFRIASERTSYGKMNTFAAGVLRKLQRGVYWCVHTHMLLLCTGQVFM